MIAPIWLRVSMALAATSLACWPGAGRADFVSFDDLALTPNSHWNGPDPAGTDFPDPFGGPLPVTVGSFSSGGATFGNSFNQNYGSWGGFAYTNEGDTTTPGFGNQFSAFMGTGHGAGADNYGVEFGYSDALDPTDPTRLADLPNFALPSGGHILGAYVTNTTYAALSMRDGDAFSKQFGGATGNDADWFKLTAYGTDATGTLLGTAELYLADFRFSDNSKDYILDQWTFFDLSPLAGASHVFFNLASTDNGFFGMNTPAFFAIDDITFSRSTSATPEPGGLALAAVGGLSLVFVRRLRKKKSA